MSIDTTITLRGDFSHLQPEGGGAPLITNNPLDAGGSRISFTQSVWQAVREVDAQGQAANARMEDVDSGRSDDLVGAMLASQEASLSFSMLMQVRNKVVGAVEDLIKLQL